MYTVSDIPADMAKDALQVQDACNLSGVVRSFADHLGKIWDLARERHQGTDWVNRHPVAVLFASKIASLTRSEPMENYMGASDLCEQAASAETTNG